MTLVIAFACSDSTSPVPPGQRYLFEIEYVNFAWGYQHRGYVIDKEGQVFRYNLSGKKPWQPEDRDAVTLQELDEKYSSNQTRATFVSKDALFEMLARSSTVDPDNVSEGIWRCADAGGTAYQALVLDPDRKVYRPVLLRLEGDWFVRNLSEEAQTLYEWLDATVKGDLANCEAPIPEQ